MKSQDFRFGILTLTSTEVNSETVETTSISTSNNITEIRKNISLDPQWD